MKRVNLFSIMLVVLMPATAGLHPFDRHSGAQVAAPLE